MYAGKKKCDRYLQLGIEELRDETKPQIIIYEKLNY